MQLTSPAFKHNDSIPTKYTCDGERSANPPLSIIGVPEGARSLALIMDDHDVPKELIPQGVFDRWVLFNISPETKEISQGKSPGILGQNSAGSNFYTGPCPPPQYEPSEHRYIFKLYALDILLEKEGGVTKGEILSAMQGHILEEAELIGRYKRKPGN